MEWILASVPSNYILLHTLLVSKIWLVAKEESCTIVKINSLKIEARISSVFKDYMYR